MRGADRAGRATAWSEPSESVGEYTVMSGLCGSYPGSPGWRTQRERDGRDGRRVSGSIYIHIYIHIYIYIEI